MSDDGGRSEGRDEEPGHIAAEEYPRSVERLLDLALQLRRALAQDPDRLAATVVMEAVRDLGLRIVELQAALDDQPEGCSTVERLEHAGNILLECRAILRERVARPAQPGPD